MLCVILEVHYKAMVGLVRIILTPEPLSDFHNILVCLGNCNLLVNSTEQIIVCLFILYLKLFFVKLLCYFFTCSCVSALFPHIGQSTFWYLLWKLSLNSLMLLLLRLNNIYVSLLSSLGSDR